MRPNDQLSDLNFLLFASKYYNNPGCFETEEFLDDLNRIKYIKRLFNKYKESGELKERLILNHIIIFYNVFGIIPATRMLFFRLKKFKEILKPFLEFLGVMPERIYNIGLDSITIESKDIISDETITELLGKI